MQSVKIINEKVDLTVTEDVLTVEEARKFATDLTEAADKLEAALKAKAELGVFAGAKAGDMFVSKGHVFVVADPESVYYSSQVHLWRVKDEFPTHGPLAHWRNVEGYTTFRKVAGHSGQFTKSTVDKRDTYTVGGTV